jgi:hypothetical protein
MKSKSSRLSVVESREIVDNCKFIQDLLAVNEKQALKTLQATKGEGFFEGVKAKYGRVWP